MLYVAECSIDKASYELACCDEECVNGDQLPSHLWWRRLSNIYRNSHGANPCMRERMEVKIKYNECIVTITKCQLKPDCFESSLDVGFLAKISENKQQIVNNHRKMLYIFYELYIGC